MKKSLSNKNISGTADPRLRGDDGKETTKKKVAFFFSSIPAFFIPAFAFAQTQATLSISSNIPGVAANPTNPGQWINGFYTLALMFGGVLAFGAVVYGGVLYAASAGNPSKQSEGKDWIYSALLGLLLLAGAYLVLNTINPGLTSVAFPTLSSVGTAGNGSGSGNNGGGSGNSAPTTATGCAGGTCQTLPNCTQTTATTGAGAVNCGGAPGMVSLMNCVDQADPNYTVSEGYPPAVNHSDPGHNTGCAIDVHVSNCAAVSQLMSSAQSCGASKVLNEYTGCGGSTYANTTGGNIHIAAPKGQGGC